MIDSFNFWSIINGIVSHSAHDYESCFDWLSRIKEIIYSVTKTTIFSRISTTFYIKIRK